MPKVTYTKQKGLVQETGDSSVDLASGDAALDFQVGKLPRQTNVDAKTASFTATQPGVYSLGSGGAITVTLPAASTVPGGLFVFRNATAQAHIVSASNETAGTMAIALLPTMTGSLTNQTAHGNQKPSTPSNGSGVTLVGTIGNSISMFCDGVNFNVLTASGTFQLDDPERE